MVERFKKALESAENDLKASICDGNQTFVEGTIYGLKFAGALFESTLRAYETEKGCSDVKDE